LVDLFHENWNNSKVYQEKDKNKSKHHAALTDSVKHHNNILKRPPLKILDTAKKSGQIQDHLAI
jgi:predicted glycosyltransferase involved in capsule biosynthesis